jgi:hypothetical protein
MVDPQLAFPITGEPGGALRSSWLCGPAASWEQAVAVDHTGGEVDESALADACRFARQLRWLIARPVPAIRPIDRMAGGFAWMLDDRRG